MIRTAEERDLPEILEIYNEAILNTTAVYDYEPHSLEDRKQWYESKVGGGFPVLVYEADGRVAGFASFGRFRPWAAYRYTVEHSVYVHTEHRKQGIGLALLETLMQIAEDSGYAVMVAGIDAENEKSIRLHEKLGFTYSGTITKAGYKFGRWLNLSFYQLELKGARER